MMPTVWLLRNERSSPAAARRELRRIGKAGVDPKGAAEPAPRQIRGSPSRCRPPTWPATPTSSATCCRPACAAADPRRAPARDTRRRPINAPQPPRRDATEARLPGRELPAGHCRSADRQPHPRAHQRPHRHRHPEPHNTLAGLKRPTRAITDARRIAARLLRHTALASWTSVAAIIGGAADYIGHSDDEYRAALEQTPGIAAELDLLVAPSRTGTCQRRSTRPHPTASGCTISQWRSRPSRPRCSAARTDRASHATPASPSAGSTRISPAARSRRFTTSTTRNPCSCAPRSSGTVATTQTSTADTDNASTTRANTNDKPATRTLTSSAGAPTSQEPPAETARQLTPTAQGPTTCQMGK
jgi:hypothetical protein